MTTNIEETAGLTNITIQQLRSKKKITSDLATEINQLTAEKLNNLIDTVTQTIAREEKAPDLLKKFGKIPDKEKLESATKIRNGTQTIFSKEDAEKYFELTNPKAPSGPISIQFYKAKDCLQSLIESGLSTFDLGNIFSSPIDSQTKTSKILSLFALLTTFAAILIPLLGLPHGFLGIALVLLIIIICQQIYRYIRPTPVYLPNAENWSKKYWEGEFATQTPQIEKSKHLAKELASKQPLMLIGPPGSGKTELVKSLVRGIERQEYPDLKRKRLFYVNAANLTSQQLQNIVQNTDENGNNLIMVFDNLQLCPLNVQNELNLYIKDKKAFPYFIGITTTSSCVAGAKKIFIEPPSDQETALILENICAAKAPDTFVSPQALTCLSENARQEGRANPGAAITLLHRCLHKTSKNGQSSCDEKTQEAFFKARKEYLQLKEKTYKLALKITDSSPDHDKKMATLFQFYLLPAVEDSLKAEAKRLNIATEINTALIKDALKDEASILSL